jgi:hypothetical protein
VSRVEDINYLVCSILELDVTKLVGVPAVTTDSEGRLGGRREENATMSTGKSSKVTGSSKLVYTCTYKKHAALCWHIHH